MKQVLFTAILCIALAGCSKDANDSMGEITNSTGIDLYDATIHFSKTKESPAHSIPQELGNIPNGEKVKFSYNYEEDLYFSILSHTKDGELAYFRKKLLIGSQVAIYPDDRIGEH